MSRFDQLYEIADRYSCDKGLRGPSQKWSANNYVDVYQAYLGHRRFEPLKLMEIGLGVRGENWSAEISHGGNSEGGASMRMWYDFLPNSQIVGLDINPATHLDNDRITTRLLDQSNREQLAGLVSEYGPESLDVIIDDGSHIADHQQISLEELMPLLKPNGLYFIEDLNEFGVGERSGGRHSSETSVSTRRFFREYAASGEVLAPNAFSSTSFLAGIESIAFHCPAPFMRFRDLAVESLRYVMGRNKRGLLRQEFNPTSHRMVVLKKRG